MTPPGTNRRIALMITGGIAVTGLFIGLGVALWPMTLEALHALG
jgi:hypothetical protein